MTFALRDYQERSIDEIRGAYKSGKRAPLLCSPTGSGKSRTLEYMLGNTKKRTLILAHRKELVDMISKSLGVPHGLIMPGHPETDHQISVGMMQTVSRRLDRLPKFDWVISDEAHLAICPTWLKILKFYGSAWHLGMSATPCRLDGKGLGEYYDDIIYGPSVSELTERGFLVPARVFGPPTAAATVKMSGSDFSMDAASKEYSKPVIVGNAVEHVRQHAADRQTIVFCCSREHAEIVADEFSGDGIPAVNVDGALSSDERKSRIAAFRAGYVRVLTNVDLLTTGFDMPQIGCIVFLRPTSSLALYLQMVGRAARPSAGKSDYIILDHANNVGRHGFPDDDREWSLDGAEAKKKKSKEDDDAPPVKQCTSCYAIHKPAPRCPECGEVYPVKGRVIEQEEGSLSELDREKVARIRAAPLKHLLATAKTHDDLKTIAEARGYKQGWVRKIEQIRGARRGEFA